MKIFKVAPFLLLYGNSDGSTEYRYSFSEGYSFCFCKEMMVVNCTSLLLLCAKVMV